MGAPRRGLSRRRDAGRGGHRQASIGGGGERARAKTAGERARALQDPRRTPAAPRREDGEEGRLARAGSEAAIRPERFARLVTLASILIQAGRAGEPVSVADVCEKLQLSEEELHEDVNVLNVVNFGGGSYVLYAEIVEAEDGAGVIEVDPEPYSDNFDRPARLLPVEGKALVAAIDLIGEHIPEGSLPSAREKIVSALGEDPMEQGLQVAHAAGDDADLARLISTAIVEHRLIELEYYKAERGRDLPPHGRAVRADQRPRGLVRRLLRPRARRRAPLPPGPDQARADLRAHVRAAPRGRSRRRGRRLAAHRRGRRRRAPRAYGSPPSAPAGRARPGAWSPSAPTARSSSS